MTVARTQRRSLPSSRSGGTRLDINKNVDRVLGKYLGDTMTAKPAPRTLADHEKVDIYKRITPRGWERFARTHGSESVRSYVVEMEGLKKRLGA